MTSFCVTQPRQECNRIALGHLHLNMNVCRIQLTTEILSTLLKFRVTKDKQKKAPTPYPLCYATGWQQTEYLSAQIELQQNCGELSGIL